MMTCDPLRRLISPYVDGELCDEERQAFEQHLAGCRGCSALLQDEAAVLDLLQVAPASPAPAELRQRVARLLSRSRGGTRERFSRWWVVAASAAAAALAVTLLSNITDARARSTGALPRFVATAVESHLRFRRGQLPLDVVSSDARAVSNWFEGKVSFALSLPSYDVAPGEKKPYQLEGARLVKLERDYGAYVAYRMAKNPISLLVTTAAEVTPSGGDVVLLSGLRFHVQTAAGLNVISWSDKGLTYALVSDVTLKGSKSCLVCHESLEDGGPLDQIAGLGRTSPGVVPGQV